MKTLCLLYRKIIIYQIQSSVWVMVKKLSRVRHLPSYIPYLYRSSKEMVTFDLIQIDADLVPVKTCSVFQLDLGLGLAYLATQAGHHFTSRSHPMLENQMKRSHLDGI
jgi:hypothetical protein